MIEKQKTEKTNKDDGVDRAALAKQALKFILFPDVKPTFTTAAEKRSFENMTSAMVRSDILSSEHVDPPDQTTTISVGHDDEPPETINVRVN